MKRWVRIAFFALVVRPLLLVILGVNIRNRERLPRRGPAILIANHNSHLDTLALMAMFPLRDLPRLRPVAAVDYFLANRFFAWLALDVIGVIPVERAAAGRVRDPLAGARAALDEGCIVILYPEGTRGEPERLSRFKKGVAHLSASRPEVPVVPVFLHGFGKALPKGSLLLVPFSCDVFVGESLRFDGGIAGFIGEIEARMRALAAQEQLPTWE